MENQNNENQITVDEQQKTQSQLFREFATQEDFDNHNAGIRRNATKDAKKEVLKELGFESLEDLQKKLQVNPESKKEDEGKAKETNKEYSEIKTQMDMLLKQNQEMQTQITTDKLEKSLAGMGLNPAVQGYILADLLKSENLKDYVGNESALTNFVNNHPLAAVGGEKRAPAQKPKTQSISRERFDKINGMFAE